MKIIAKTTLRFPNPNWKPGDEKHFQTTPNPLPVEVPDWIQDDDLYALAVKGGDIIETVDTAAGGALTRNQQAAFLSGVSDADLWAEVQRRGGSPSARYQAWTDAPRGADGWPEGSGGQGGSGQGPQRVPAPPAEKTKLQLDAERIDAEAAESARKAAEKNGGAPGAKAQELNTGGKDGPHTGAFTSTDAAKAAAEDAAAGAKAGATGPATGTETSQVGAKKSGDDKTSKPQ